MSRTSLGDGTSSSGARRVDEVRGQGLNNP